jgi:hypothetical protein
MLHQCVLRAPMRALSLTVAVATVLTSMAIAAGDARALAPNSADRLIQWAKCSEVVSLSDAELDAAKERGVDGFVCMTGWLAGMGGDQEFTGNPNATLAGSSYDLQRSIRDSRLGQRLAARGMKAYLGVYLGNHLNTATPLAEWFDDAAWATEVRPKLGNLAAAAKRLGFAGLAFDQELYQQVDGEQNATWGWKYPGNRRSESDVRAQATLRGRQLMQTLLQNFPGLEIAAYYVQLPANWVQVVQREVNDESDAFGDHLEADFWDGLTSVDGYGALRLYQAVFYKVPHLGTWEGALQYEMNNTYAYLSRKLSNWDYAASRLHVTPFSWINPGPESTAWDDAQPVGEVSEQLDEFRRWGAGGEFADFVYGSLRKFDYSRYSAAMATASTPAVVDDSPPALEHGEPVQPDLTSPHPTTGASGTAGDDYAIRAVRWSTDHGAAGAARHEWKIDSGDPTEGPTTWHTEWTADGIPLAPGPNQVTFTAEDIHGLTTSRTVTVMGPPIPPDTAAPAVTVKVRGARLRRALRRGLRVMVTTDEPAAAAVAARVRGRAARALRRAGAKRPALAGRGSRKLPAAGRHAVRVKFSKRAKRRFRRTRKLRLTLAAKLSDAHGNATRRTVRVRLRR